MQQLNTNYDKVIQGEQRKQGEQREQRKRICSWCYNGCKNKKVYTSHNMKNYKGEITCK